MKKLLLLAALLSMPVVAIQLDEVKQSFELTNVSSADWYNKGDSMIAESSNQYRDMKINLSQKHGAVSVKLKPNSSFDAIAIMPCYKLVKMVDYQQAKTWGDDATKDELIIKSVFNADLKNGESNSQLLNGWQLTMQRKANMFTCEVVKQ